MKLVSNGNGVLETKMKGTVKGYGHVCYHPESVANILSFANVRKKFEVSISTGPRDKNPTITVIKSNGQPRQFKEIETGLYVYDATSDISNIKNKNILNKSSCHYSLVSTVKNNESKFTNRKIRNAKLALDLHCKVGRPSIQSLIDMLQNNMIQNFPVTTTDARHAFTIYGEDVPSI